MKKVFKIAGKIIGGYAVLNTLVLAWVGVGRIIKYSYDNPGASHREFNAKVIDEAAESWKLVINDVKSIL